MAGPVEIEWSLDQVLGGTYALQYHYDGRTILMLRAFHGRETK